MEKYLGRGILLFTCLVLLLAFLFPYEPKPVNLNDGSFATTGEARLFFNNTRAFYYTFKEIDEAGFTVYTFGGTDKTNSKSCINFFIVHNWRDSEAYIMSKPSDHFGGNLNLEGAPLLYDFEQMTSADHYEMASKIFLNLLSDKQSTTEMNAIFGDEENTRANLVVLKDYFRLIGKYQ